MSREGTYTSRTLKVCCWLLVMVPGHPTSDSSQFVAHRSNSKCLLLLSPTLCVYAHVWAAERLCFELCTPLGGAIPGIYVYI